MINTKIIDLNISFDINDKIINFYKQFYKIDIVGCRNSKKLCLNNLDSIILRKKNIPSDFSIKFEYFFLTEANYMGNTEKNYSNIDIITINDFDNLQNLLKKLSGKNVGIEFLLSDLFKCHGLEISTWIHRAKYFYYLCEKYHHQFILSSGAHSLYNLLSYKMFNVFLEKLDINPNRYWEDVNKWLNVKKRGLIYGP